MIILGIESSCDETSVALLKCTNKCSVVLNESTITQIDIHKKYGGVVPELAGRAHAEKIIPLIESVMDKQKKPDAIAVTTGPGLITGLLVGVEAARSLSYLWDIPLIPVNHIEGHIHSVEINNDKLNYPALALIVSGGHTELIYMEQQGKFEKLGGTKDDAAGECFDKVAKLLGYEYPGGPKISDSAENGKKDTVELPRPMITSPDYDFSFSGLKTAALYWLRDNELNDKITINDFCASFQQAIIDVLVKKTLKVIKEKEISSFILAGGVSANKELREQLSTKIKDTDPKIDIRLPEFKYSLDNSTMIAAVGYHKFINGKQIDWKEISADPNSKVYE